MWLRICVSLSLFLLPACVAPARTATDYQHKAVDTAEAVLSSVETGSLVVTLGPRQAFPPFLAVALSDAERGVASTRAVFLSLQPPDARSDEVRAELSPLLDRSEDVIAASRIAARRQDLDALLRSADGLSQAADALERFIARYG